MFKIIVYCKRRCLAAWYLSSKQKDHPKRSTAKTLSNKTIIHPPFPPLVSSTPLDHYALQLEPYIICSVFHHQEG